MREQEIERAPAVADGVAGEAVAWWLLTVMRASGRCHYSRCDCRCCTTGAAVAASRLNRRAGNGCRLPRTMLSVVLCSEMPNSTSSSILFSISPVPASTSDGRRWCRANRRCRAGSGPVATRSAWMVSRAATAGIDDTLPLPSTVSSLLMMAGPRYLPGGRRNGAGQGKCRARPAAAGWPHQGRGGQAKKGQDERKGECAWGRNCAATPTRRRNLHQFWRNGTGGLIPSTRSLRWPTRWRRARRD